jgi:hypothetical protein
MLVHTQIIQQLLPTVECLNGDGTEYEAIPPSRALPKKIPGLLDLFNEYPILA